MTKLVKNIRKPKKVAGISNQTAFFYGHPGQFCALRWIHLNVQHLEVGIYQ